MNITELARKRKALWMSLEALYDFEEIPEFHTLRQSGYLTAREPKIKFFISHPWETPVEPDPSGHQWKVLKETFRHYLNPYDWTGLHDGGAGSHIMPPRVEKYIMRIDSHYGFNIEFSKSIQNVYRVREQIPSQCLYYLHDYIKGGTVTEGQHHKIQRNIGIWLDYCCLPQKNLTPDEEEYIRYMMPQIIYLAAISTMLALWQNEDKQMKRAWCFVEYTINYSAGNFGVVKPKTEYKYVPYANLNDKIMFANLAANTTKEVENILTLARSSNTFEDVFSWMKSNGKKCTIPSDLSLLAKAVFASNVPVRKMGFQAVLLSIIANSLELFWLLIMFPFLAMYPLASNIGVKMDRMSNEHPDIESLKKFWLIIPAFTYTLIFGLICILIGALSLIFYPIEFFRQKLKSSLLRSRGDYILKISVQ